MIEPHVFLLTDHGTSVELQITVVESTGSGIKKVILLDKDRLEFFAVGPEECPREFTFSTLVATGRFPIFVEGTDCNDIVSGSKVPIALLPAGVIGKPGIPRPCSPVNCDKPTAACAAAIAALERVRRLIVEKCAEIEALHARRDGWIAAAVAFAAAAVIMFAVAVAAALVPFAGQVLVAILAAVGALFLLLALVFGSLAASVQFEIEARQRELGSLRAQFLDETDQVRENCCVDCIFIDLNLPGCARS